VAWPQAETLPLFRREVRERLSRTALACLLARAEVHVEGGLVRGRSAKGAFLGTAMITIDLPAAADRLRPPHDEATARRLAEALLEDAVAQRALTDRALEVARARLSVPRNLRALAPQIRADGARVHVDLELEGRA
jgi:hypothetical protein